MFRERVFNDAQERLARHYVGKLEQLAARFMQGGDEERYAIRHFQSDWEQIHHTFLWSQKRSTELCSEISVVGAELLDVCQTPDLRIDWYEKALEAAQSLGDNQAIANHLIGLGSAYLNMGNLPRADHHFSRAATIATPMQRARLNNLHGQLKFLSDEYDQAWEMHQTALELSRQFGLAHEEAFALRGMGVIALRRGQLEDARNFNLESVYVAQQANLEEPMAAACANLGRIMTAMRQFESGTEYYKKSLAILEKLGLHHRTASIYINLGLNADATGDYATAEIWHRKSLKVAQQFGDQIRAGRAISNLGGVLIRAGNIDEGRFYLEQALALRRDLGHKFGVAATLNELGKLAFSSGGYRQALAYQRESMAICYEIGNVFNAIEVQAEIAEILIVQGALDEAKQNLIESLSVAFEFDSDPLYATILVQAAIYFFATRQHSTATQIAANLSAFDRIDHLVREKAQELLDEMGLTARRQFEISELAAHTLEMLKGNEKAPSV